MSDRRTIIALLLIGVIMLLTPYYMRLVSPPPPPETAADSLAAAGGERAVVDTLEPAEEVVAVPQVSREVRDPAAEEALGRALTVVTPLYQAGLNTQGAVLDRWRLFGFGREGSGPLDLVPVGAMGLLIELLHEGGRLDGSTLLFDVSAPDTIRLEEDESYTLTLTASAGGEQRIVRVLEFSGDTYDVRVVDRFEGFSVSALDNGYRLWWLGGLEFTEPSRREELTYTNFSALQGGDRHRTKLKRELVESQLSGSIEWTALRTKYFASITVPRSGPFRSVAMEGIAGDLGPANMNMHVERGLAQEGPQVVETLLYVGPIDIDLLSSYEVGLERMMDFGWGFIRPISRLILTVFTFLHGLIPNYGIVIIVFSVLVKLAVFPLTRKSYQSMHAMQELAPKMQEIKEKYKDEPEKMNRKTMNLYKEHGVNPLGGCFPLLLQMPIFWALFTIFRSTIELRGAPFALWITDLSLKDPYMVLPALMGITMFIQQNAQMKNPQQRAMVYIMPVMMFLLMKGFPAGLILYWTMFNIFSIVQTELVHQRPKEEPTSPRQA
jgi:YidC/Oxa1 family membrane protein insertase